MGNKDSRSNIPDISHAFARTNIQTIRQRVSLLKELLPGVSSVAEICCGDCQAQNEIYRTELGIRRFCGLDLSPDVVALNRSRNIPCECGDALEPSIIRKFLDFDVLFYGPPLSIDCDGHRLITFREVTPDYFSFSNLLLHKFNYKGLIILIGPRSTTLGDASLIDHHIQLTRPDYRLRLIHYSYSDVTGLGEQTAMRLKYVELWFEAGRNSEWEIRESKGSHFKTWK